MGEVASFECACGLRSERLFLGFGEMSGQRHNVAAACDDCVRVFAAATPLFCDCGAGPRNMDDAGACRACGARRAVACPTCGRGERRVIERDRRCPACGGWLRLLREGVWD